MDDSLQFNVENDELNGVLDDSLDELPSIFCLNDDCFYEIVDYLPPIDCCSFRETCKHFRTIADYCFEKNYKSIRLTPEIIYRSSEKRDVEFNDAKRVIRNFGHLIKKISIGRFNINYDAVAVLPFLDRYCQQLRDLELILYGFYLQNEIISVTQRLFSNLHRFVLIGCHMNDNIASCLECCVALKELEMFDIDNMYGGLVNSFGSLESLAIVDCQIDTASLVQFFASNKNLKNVKYIIGDDEMIEALQLIRFPVDIERLEIDFGHGGKVLAANSGTNQILGFLANETSLEHLSLRSANLNDESVDSLCKLKKLKTLHLTSIVEVTKNILNPERCKKLACELTDLTEVHIITCRGVTFKNMNEFIVNSRNLKKLSFYHYLKSVRSLTSKMILDAIEVRRKFGNGTLSILLSEEDFVHIIGQIGRNASSKTFFEQQNIIKLLPNPNVPDYHHLLGEMED